MWRLSAFLITEIGCLDVSVDKAALLRTRIVIVWRVLISSSSFVWERKLLKSEYSGKPERMSVILWAEMVAVRVRKRRIVVIVAIMGRVWSLGLETGVGN